MAFATASDQYAAANCRLAKSERLFYSGRKGAGGIASRRTRGGHPLCCPRIGIFAGQGASHSWLWFVDLFDRMGFHDLSLLDETAIRDAGLSDLDVLAVSGGDTFAIAAALGERGAGKIRAFITDGGLYIGSCAGAYLAMQSSKPPLNLFNFAPVRITNLSKHLPACHQMTYKFSTPYGCGHVFHPVREAVCLRLTGRLPFAGPGYLTAPLYGGPGMLVSDVDQILAYYESFTNKTAFLVDEELARATLIGKAAAVRTPLGRGCLHLLGPHLEHPHYPRANRLVADLVCRDTKKPTPQAPIPRMTAEKLPASDSRLLVRGLKRELSNSRIVAAGLEMQPVRWQIGAKFYETEKIRVFLESMWRRVKAIEDRGRLRTAGSPAELMASATETTGLLRLLKNELDENRDTTDIARRLFALLRGYTALFLRLYFLNVSEIN
ncbi:MAG: BPL-N domain-containing protein [Desulfobacterales bacterium]